MILVRDNFWPKNDAFGDPTPLDQSVMRPIAVDDVDEPVDAVTGLAIGIIGGVLMWAVMLFVLVRLV